MAVAPRSISTLCEALGAVGDISLRPWTVDDASTLLSAWTDAEIARWNPVPPDPSQELAENWIHSTASQNEASVGIDVVAVRNDGESDTGVLGELGLQVDPVQAIGEVGFWVGSRHRGSGVGRSLLTFARALGAELELRGLVALVDPENGSALGLLESMAWSEIPTKSNRRAFALRLPQAP